MHSGVVNDPVLHDFLVEWISDTCSQGCTELQNLLERLYYCVRYSVGEQILA